METRTHGGNQEPSALPQEALAALLESIPQGKLLRLLKQSEPVCQQVFHGFTVQPASLHVPIVRRRLRERLERDEEFLVDVVTLWDRENPDVRRAVQERSVNALRQDLSQLAQRWGSGALAIALAADERASVRELLESKAKVLEKFSRVVQEQEDVVEEVFPTPPQPSAEVQSLREEAERWQKKYAALNQQLQERVRGLEQEKAAHRKAVQHAASLQKQWQQSQAAVAALEKQADRASRQKQKVEREKQDLHAENKRLKKQVRQLTLALEEARRQASRPGTQSAEDLPQTPQPSTPNLKSETRNSRQVGTLSKPEPRPETVLRWNVNGDRYSVPIAQLVQAVDTNQEAFVFKVANDLKRLRQSDAEQFAAIIQRLRRIGRYYAQVLTQPTMRVIVDGSNVAHAEKNWRGQAQLRNVLGVRDELRARDFFPIRIYGDASLPYQIDQRDELERLVDRGEIHLVPSGTSADDIIAREAKDLGCYVVTNDRRLTHHIDPTWELQMVGFAIVEGHVMLEDF